MDTEIADVLSSPPPPLVDLQQPAPIKRETESVDDFEHLEAENNSANKDSGDKAVPQVNPIEATKDFLAELTGGFASAPPPESFSFDKPLPQEPASGFDSKSFLEAEAKPPSPVQDGEGPETPPPPPVPRHQNLQESHHEEDRFSPSPEPEFLSLKPSSPSPVHHPQTPEPFVEPVEKKVQEPPPAPPKVEEPPRPVEPPKKPEPEPPFVKEEKKPRTPPPQTVVKSSEELPDIGAKDLFVKYGLVESLVYWREPKKSGAVFGVLMVTLLSLTYFSLISVVAYLCLATLILTIAFRIYKNVMQAVQKTSDGHPFNCCREWLEVDVTVPEDKVREMSVVAVARMNRWVIELRRLFLVEDLVDSIKFAILLWALTNVGAWFNGLTLVIIGVVAMFTLPKVYENNKAQVDAYVSLATAKISEITNKVKAAVPMGKKDSDKPKDQ